MPAQEWLLCFQECVIYSSAFDPGSIHCLRAWASHVAGAGFLQANGATMFLLFASPVYTDLRLPQSRYKIKVEERWIVTCQTMRRCQRRPQTNEAALVLLCARGFGTFFWWPFMRECCTDRACGMNVEATIALCQRTCPKLPQRNLRQETIGIVHGALLEHCATAVGQPESHPEVL